MASPTGATSAKKTGGEAPKRGLRRDELALSGAGQALIAALEPVIVDEPLHFIFDTSVSRKHLIRFWTWVARDVMPDIEMKFDGFVEAGNAPDAAIELCLPEILSATRTALSEVVDFDANRRLTVQLGGEEVRDRVDVILLALRSRSLINKARGFGKAAAGIADDASLGVALQSLPLKDQALCALLMHTIVGQIAAPSRLVSAASHVAGRATEDAIRGAGFGPLGDAILAHAQHQLTALAPALVGLGDFDAACRALDRFHKLSRAIGSYLELGRNSRWSTIVAELTKQASLRLEPRLREISGDIAQSMRRARDSQGNDRVDTDRLLAALNGMYLLSSVREARESLALNALFEQIWNETGQSIEILVKRTLEEFRVDPGNQAVGKRLDTGIKMAEIRFNSEYAEVLSRARDKFSRRAAG
ncbi:MAG: hypothetical protein KKH72_12265 [Alphaproteobacteria bacterium]|nr:hypothetical protein [Alphaproteobacteria bacterium]